MCRRVSQLPPQTPTTTPLNRRVAHAACFPQLWHAASAGRRAPRRDRLPLPRLLPKAGSGGETPPRGWACRHIAPIVAMILHPQPRRGRAVETVFVGYRLARGGVNSHTLKQVSAYGLQQALARGGCATHSRLRRGTPTHPPTPLATRGGFSAGRRAGVSTPPPLRRHIGSPPRRAGVSNSPATPRRMATAWSLRQFFITLRLPHSQHPPFTGLVDRSSGT